MTSLTKRLALPVLAVAVLCLAFAGVASAHSLSVDKAESRAQGTGNKKVRDSDGDYVKATAQKCKKLYPHIVRCSIGYDTKKTLPGKKYDCVDTIELYYKAHDDDEKPNYTVYYRRTKSTAGGGGC